MISCSTAAKNAILNGGSSAHQYPTVKITLYPGDSSKIKTITVSSSDIVQGGLTIDRSCVNNDGAIELGTTVASELTLMIDNSSGKYTSYDWAGAWVYPAIGMIVADSEESIPLGVFEVDETNISGNVISLSCLDRMVWFDKSVQKANVKSTKQSPYEFVKTICKECSVAYSSNFDNYFKFLPNNWDSDKSAYYQFTYWYSDTSSNPSGNTYRNLLNQIGVLCGVNWYMNTSGELDYKKLPTKGATWGTNYIRPGMRWSSTRETLPVVLNSIKYTYNNATTVLKGYDNQTSLDLGTFTLFRSSNKASTVKSWLTRMATGINIYGIRYYPFTASCVPLFWYEPMDQVRFVDSDGKEYNSIITSCTYTVNGTMALQSTGTSANKSDNAVKYRYNGATNFDAKISESLANSVITNLQKIHANTSGLHTGEISGNLLMWLDSTFESTSTAAIATVSEESDIMLADVIETASNDTATVADTDDEEVVEVPADGTAVWRMDEDGTVLCTDNWQGSVEESTWTSGVDAASDLYVRNLFAKTITASGEIKYQSEDGTAITSISSSGIASKSTGGGGDVYIMNGMVEATSVRASQFCGVGGNLIQYIHASVPVTKSVPTGTWTTVLTTKSLSKGYYTGSVACTFPMSTSKGLRVAVTTTASSPTSTDFVQDGVASTLQADHINLPVTFAFTSDKTLYIWAYQSSGNTLAVTADYDLLYIAQTPTSKEVANG